MGRNRSFRTSPRLPRYIQEAEASVSLAGPDPPAIREAAAAWISTLCPWDLYCTLTYDPAKTGYVVNKAAHVILPPGSYACQRHFARWADACAHRCQREVLAIGALEATKLGWPHFHVVVSMGGCNPEEFRAVSEEWYRPYGFAALDRFPKGDTAAVAAYIGKYFTKDNVELSIRGQLPNKVLPAQRWLTGLKVERSKRDGAS